MSSLKDKTVKGVIWSAVDRFSAQGIQFVFSILITRSLMPKIGRVLGFWEGRMFSISVLR